MSHRMNDQIEIAAQMALDTLKQLDGTHFTFPEPRQIIDRAKDILNEALG